MTRARKQAQPSARGGHSTAGLPFKVRVRELRETRLLSVAERMLATRGCEQFTTEEVAKRLGVGKGTVYSHCASQRALIQTVLSHVSDRLLARLQIAAANDPPGQLVRVVSQVVGEIVACPKGALRYPCCLKVSPCPYGGCQGIDRALQGLIAGSARAGAIRPDIDDSLAACSFQHLLSAAVNHRGGYHIHKNLVAVSQLFLGGLLNIR